MGVGLSEVLGLGPCWSGFGGTSRGMREAHLARVDFLTAKGVVVGTHDGGLA